MSQTELTCDSQAAVTAEKTQVRTFVPRVDIYETDEAIHLTAEMPGVEEGGLDLTLDKNVLTIQGQVHLPVDDGTQMLRREYEVGHYERSFTVPDRIDRQGIAAELQAGLLHLVMKKTPLATQQKITVKTVN